MTNAIDGLKEISSVLKGCGLEDTYREAEVILDYLGIGKVALYRDNPVLSGIQMEQLKKVADRRRRSEPLQYIMGHVDFCGLKIKVGPGVLIPRPETELLAEEAIEAVKRNALCVINKDYNLSPITHHPLRILDLCTGSGCLALAIAKNFEDCSVVGIDLSETALEYARENAKINGIRNVTFRRGDLYEPVRGDKFDIIVSNPPYIKRGDINGLAAEIKNWEPIEAIDGGEDGLRFYRAALSRAADYLFKGGSFIFELGQGEMEAVREMAAEAGLMFVCVTKDYAGIERVLHLKQRLNDA